MKVLLTGSEGRIGRAIRAEFEAARIAVDGVDRIGAQPRDVLALSERDFDGIDVVIHSAALHAPHVGALPDAAFWRDNVAATKHLVETAARAGVRRFVYTSTTALYGAGAAAGRIGRAAWIDDGTKPLPQTIYHRTKIAAEDVLRDAGERLSLSVVSLRMSRCFPEPLPEMIIHRLHRGIDERDVASAHVLAVARIEPGFRVYNISAQTPFSREDTEALFADAPTVIRARAPIVAAAFHRRGWPLPARIDRVYDASLAMRELDWQPRHDAAAMCSEND